tara:strand:- start:514 stop:879 length:366 start_codon:yes stop_codon:yes gene_type:complete
MNKIFYLVGMLLVGFGSHAQFVNGVPFQAINVEYVEIKVVSGSLRFENIEIDYGQETSYLTPGKESTIRDEFGKPMNFNSKIDALNFMSQNGYGLIEVLHDKDGAVTGYLLRNRRYQTGDR